MECRIDTIDAPETPKPQYGKPGQPYGREAKKQLEQMILDKEVNIRIVKPKDKDGRPICQVEIEGKGVDQVMVEQGAAWVFDYFAKDTLRNPALQAAQNTARKKKVGLWQDPDPEYPYNYKQRYK